MTISMPNLSGKTDKQKIDALIKVVTSILEQQNAPEKENEKLPVGTIILRKNTNINAGMNYGEWMLISDTIKLSYGTLWAYIRTK